MKKFYFVACFALLLSSCYVQTVKVDPDIKRSEPRGEEDYSKWEHFFIFGLVPDAETDAYRVCKNKGGVAFVETRLSFLNQLVGLLTLDLYSPSTTYIYCSDSQK